MQLAAPFARPMRRGRRAGRVRRRFGQDASGTTGFMTLVDPRDVRVDVTVDETDVAWVAVGKAASVTFDAIQGRPFRGKVISIAPSGTLNQGVGVQNDQLVEIADGLQEGERVLIVVGR